MSRLRSLRSMLILAYMFSILWVRRNPLSLIYLVFSPFTVVFLLYIIVGVEFLPYALSGAYIMVIVYAGTAVVGDAAWHKLDLKFQDMMVASPVSQSTYMIGESLSEFLYSSPAIAVILILLSSFGLTAENMLTVIFVTLLLWLSMTSLGFSLSTYMPNIRNAWQTSLILGLALAVLPPVFYPVETIPPELQWLAYLIPTTHSALLIRSSLGLNTAASWHPAIGWLVLSAYSAAFFILAFCRARWREA